MQAEKHMEYTQENERLGYTKEYIEKTLEATVAYRNSSKDTIKEALSEMDEHDSSQNYIDVLINTKFIEIADRNYDGLTKALKKPYFSRIDFREQGKDIVDRIYIGKTSLYRAEDEIPLIVDWRAPIANVYYEGRIGDASYTSEGVALEGELLLKRQYTINDGHLTEILDVDITTNDAFLQAALEASAEDKLKDIASTIQAEQNRVIRADMARPLIVQGVAGSGKTTIALHRIAYFIYTYEKLFDPDTFMIIAPNRLFINYISEVLPELGVEKVVQTTFIDLMSDLVGTKFTLVDPNIKLVDLIHAHEDEDSKNGLELMKWASAFKGSIDFKDIVDSYVKDIVRSFTPKEDFSFYGQVIIGQESIERMISESISYLPLYKTVNEVKKTLRNQLKLFAAELSRITQNKYDRQIRKLWNTVEPSEDRRLRIVDLIDTRDKKLEEIRAASSSLVKTYLAKFRKIDLFSCYKELVTNELMIHRHSKDKLATNQVAYLCRHSSSLLNRKTLELEDYAPLVYLKHKLIGFGGDIGIRSVVIDEAQDFSIFQLCALKAIFNTEMFTLLGDVSQGIHSYRGIQKWEDVQEHVFNTKDSTYLTLVQSYRTTIEIMKLANEVITKLNNPQVVLADPVIRHGDKPERRHYQFEEALLEGVAVEIRHLQSEHFKSIAVICKTKDECSRVQKYLEKVKDINAVILSEIEDHYNAGVVIVPSYMAKGLEFDAVLIVTIMEKYREEELDIKLLYVAMTRALHRLTLFHLENQMPVLKSVEEIFFTEFLTNDRDVDMMDSP